MQVEPTNTVHISYFYSSYSTAYLVLPDMGGKHVKCMSPWLPFPKCHRTLRPQHQPKALHLGSFSVCLGSSVDKAAAPADNPDTDKFFGFSGGSRFTKGPVG